MFGPVRNIAHYAGDITAAFMYPVFAAMFDALYGRHLDDDNRNKKQ